MAEQNANNVAITGGTISGVSGIGTVTSVAATAGTGISVTGSPITTSGTLNITNTAPDQTVVLTAGTGISTSGTYPNFTITNTSPSLGGDVVGPASATDNAVARYDATTGKLIQNSAVIIDDLNNVTGVNTLTTANLIVNDDTTLGGSNADTVAVNGRITTDLEPNANNAKDIGTSGRNWRDGFFGRTLHTVNLELTGTTSFDGSQGTSGQVLTSAGTGATPTWTTPTTGTVTSIVAGTGLSGGTITTSGTIAIDSTVVTLTGTQTLTNKTLTSPTLTTATTSGKFTFGGAIDETVFAVSGTTPALSPSNGTIQTWTLSGNSTPTAGTFDAGESMTLMIDDGTAYTVTWTSVAVTWVGGTAPTLATSGYTVIELWKVGSTIYGALVGNVA
jgi:hypothetical protein